MLALRKKTEFPLQIISKVFQNVTYRDLLQCRRVCKKWNTWITSSPVFRSRLVYIFNGEGGEDTQNWYHSLRTFLGSSPFWRSFEFYSLDMETYCLANHIFFEYFVLNYTCTLTTLRFADCENLSMGRFMELVAFCKMIQVIKIANCPHLFTTSIENWENYKPLFLKNMKQLRELGIQECREDVNVIWPEVLDVSRNLQRFDIYTEIDVPGEIIVTLALQNNNLQELNLGIGDLTLQEFKLLFSSNLRLRILCMHGMKLPSHFPFPTPAIDNLDSLGLRSCSCYDSNDPESDRAQEKIFFRSRDISRMEISTNDESAIDTVISSIFSEERTRVRRMSLLSISGDHLAKLLFKTPNVTYLEVSSNCCSAIESIPLQPICDFLPHLQVLRIKDNNILRKNPPPQLSRLLSLQDIGVSRSDFGDDLLAILPQLQNLRVIKLKATAITHKGLLTLLQSCRSKLTKLENLKVLDCKQCIITQLDFQLRVYEYAPHINASLNKGCTNDYFGDSGEIHDFYS